MPLNKIKSIHRRSFLRSTTALASPLLITTSSLASLADPLPADVVKEYVRVAHADLVRVKEIITQYPHILNAAHDWGDGDFETAIGAAGHMGLRDMALYLLEQGARADIFVMTMLGETEMVKSTLEKYPALLKSIGPHGLTLLHHANKGGNHALELVEYLKAKGLTETHIPTYKK